MLKLKLGPPPDNDLVRHDAHWKALAGYDTTPEGALRMLTVGFICTLITYGLWSAFVPGALPVSWPSVLLTLAIVSAVVVVHETIHLLAFPGGGVGNAVVGFWPTKGAAYVEYTLPVVACISAALCSGHARSSAAPIDGRSCCCCCRCTSSSAASMGVRPERIRVRRRSTRGVFGAPAVVPLCTDSWQRAGPLHA